MMFLVKMMTNREEGYNVVAKATTEDEAREYVRALRLYYSPIDVYYTVRPNTQAKQCLCVLCVIHRYNVVIMLYHTIIITNRCGIIVVYHLPQQVDRERKRREKDNTYIHTQERDYV